MAKLTIAELEELTPEQQAAATMLAARAANFAIRNAAPKFAPEQQAKIHENAREDYPKEALAKVRASRDASTSRKS